MRPVHLLISAALIAASPALAAPAAASAGLPAVASRKLEAPFALERLQRLEACLELYARTPRGWPGYDLLAYTLVFADDQGTAYLMNTQPGGSVLEADAAPVPGLKRLRRLAPEAVKRYGLASSGIHETKNFGEEIIQIVTPIPHPDASHEFTVLLHEAFHGYQDEHFVHAQGLGNDSTLSEADYVHFQAEAWVLAALLDVRDPAKLRRGLTLYRSLQARHARLVPPGFTAYRQGMTITEGTAQYLANRFLSRLDPDAHQHHTGYTPQHLQAALRRLQDAEDRTRYYTMGSALCLILDELLPSWKGRLTDLNVSFDSLLAEVVPSPEDPDAAIRDLGPEFRLESRQQEARSAYARIQAAEAEEKRQALARHRQGGATRLLVTLPGTRTLHYGGTWAVFYRLDADRELLECKTFEARVKTSKRAVLSFGGTALELTTGVREGYDAYEFLRNIAWEDLKLNGQSLKAGPGPWRGALALDKAGLRLDATEAEVRRDADGTIRIEILKP